MQKQNGKLSTEQISATKLATDVKKKHALAVHSSHLFDNK